MATASPTISKAKSGRHPTTGQFESARGRASRSPSFQPGEWEPSAPENAVLPSKKIPDDFTVEEDSDDDTWHTPPESSHLERFKIFDWPKRTKAEIAAAKKPARNPFTGKIVKRESDPLKPTNRVIAVVFEAKGRWPRSEYWYFFSDFSQANETYEKMVEAESPGELIHSVMIAEGIPYRKIA